MHATQTDDPKRAGRGLPRPAGAEQRFDGDSARKILERAAAEQQRLNNELAGSYTFEELRQMAAEAGISPEALRAAVEAHAASRDDGGAGLSDAAPRRRRPALAILPGRGSRARTGAVLATAGGLGLVGLMVAFPAVAQSALWALLAFLILVAVLVALGASPF